MVSPMHALRVLEFELVRTRLKDQCETAVGAASAETIQPSFDEEEIWQLVARTAEAHQLLAMAPPPSLGPVRDLRDALKRASKGGALGGQELFQIGDALAAMR